VGLISNRSGGACAFPWSLLFGDRISTSHTRQVCALTATVHVGTPLHLTLLRDNEMASSERVCVPQ